MEEAIRDEVAAETSTPTTLPPNIFEAPGPVKLQRRLTLTGTGTPTSRNLMRARIHGTPRACLKQRCLIGILTPACR